MELTLSREKAYVAVKVCVSEGRQDAENRELQVMQELASGHPSSEHVLRILDNFDEEGPNGIHKCLVLELLGPSVSDTIDARFSDGRLPGNIAKSIAKQALWGLDTLHQQKIGHGGKSFQSPLILEAIILT
jgi:serine/threonine protein kinase